jgi:hypothetical protein
MLLREPPPHPGDDEVRYEAAIERPWTREGDRYPARFVSPVAFFPSIGSRDAALNRRFREAMARGTWGDVASLRRDPHEPMETCWLRGPDFCLSTSPA